MENNKTAEKGFWKTFGVNFSTVVAVDFVIALIILLIWNTALTWIVPQAPSIGYWNAFGLSTLFIVSHMVIDYWVKKYVAIKSIKAIQAVMTVTELQNNVDDIRKRLTDKGIL